MKNEPTNTRAVRKRVVFVNDHLVPPEDEQTPAVSDGDEDLLLTAAIVFTAVSLLVAFLVFGPPVAWNIR